MIFYPRWYTYLTFLTRESPIKGEILPISAFGDDDVWQNIPR